MDLQDFLQRYTDEVYLARDPEALVALYRAMVLTRTFDNRAVAMG